MNIQSKLSGHWTDEQLIASLYGVGPDDGHAAQCALCQSRLAAMTARRETHEHSAADGSLAADFLHAQRRRIYEKITTRNRWWHVAQIRRWAPGAAALLLLSGGLLVYEQHQPRPVPGSTLTDAQLAQDVSQLADNEDASPAAPVQALFE